MKERLIIFSSDSYVLALWSYIILLNFGSYNLAHELVDKRWNWGNWLGSLGVFLMVLMLLTAILSGVFEKMPPSSEELKSLRQSLIWCLVIGWWFSYVTGKTDFEIGLLCALQVTITNVAVFVIAWTQRERPEESVSLFYSGLIGEIRRFRNEKEIEERKKRWIRKNPNYEAGSKSE